MVLFFGIIAGSWFDDGMYKPQAKEYYDLYLNARNETCKLQNQLESLQIKISKIEDILNENCEV